MMRRVLFALNLWAVAIYIGCGAPATIKPKLSAGSTVSHPDMDRLHEDLATRINAAPAQVMSQSGLAGAMGGTHLKLIQSGDQEVFLPIPQLTSSQVPLCFYIRSKPAEAVKEYRVCRRAGENDVMTVRLNGKLGQEVEIEWSAVVLLSDKPALSTTAPDAYRAASTSAQSGSSRITELAKTLWPTDGKVEKYAANIQKQVGQMKQSKPPRSLDAIGILDSGANGICTANANLGAALLRAKGVAARSMAVIPTTSQRLEIHRIVEFSETDDWQAFDPSSLHTEIPMKPYQSVIMAKSSVDDENVSMTPRMGSMTGCPYGQELEFLTAGVSFAGQDFFWSTARPLAEFAVDDASVEAAAKAWKEFLGSGNLRQGQVEAAAATSVAELKERLGGD